MKVSIQKSIKMTPRTTRKTTIATTSSSIQNQTFLCPISKSDRFIPNRSAMDLEKSSHSLLFPQYSSFEGGKTDIALSDDDFPGGNAVASNMAEYNSTILQRMGEGGSKNSHRILSFDNCAPAPRGNTIHDLDILRCSPSFNSTVYRNDDRSTKLVNRHIPSSPSRVLDAPDMMDDYYLNLLSWSSTNVLAVALSQRVYLWDAETGRIEELCNFEDRGMDANVSSVSWIQEGGGYLAVGTSWGKTLLWDVQAQKQVRNMNGHSARISSLSWNRHILSSGGGDNLVVNHDVRIAEHKVATLSNHTQEVCGLEWSPDGTILASGANDNTVCLWDATASSSSRPRFEFTDHQAAVKALAWSPHERNLLATGGGTGDKCIKFWNTQTGSLLNSIDTGSQVSGLQWNPKEREILSSHGYTENHLSLWKYPTMAKMKELKGHTDRVLHMAVSPDGCSVVSAAADETLRFWNVFATPSKSLTKKRGRSSAVSGRAMNNKLSRTMPIR